MRVVAAEVAHAGQGTDHGCRVLQARVLVGADVARDHVVVQPPAGWWGGEGHMMVTTCRVVGQGGAHDGHYLRGGGAGRGT